MSLHVSKENSLYMSEEGGEGERGKNINPVFWGG